MTKDDCIFCKIIKGEMKSNTIFENSEFKVILDAFPGTRGHVLIIPKIHVENIFDIDMDLGARLFSLAISLSKVLKNTFGLEGLNVLQNNGEIAGQTVNHFHMHLIPRYRDDNVTIKWQTLKLSDEEFSDICSKIKKELE